MIGTTRFFRLAALCALGSLLVCALDWPVYRHDLDNSGAVPGPARVAKLMLRPQWTYRSRTWITSTPVIAQGLVYVGTWGGDVLALDVRDGRLRWSVSLGANPDELYGQTRGVVSSIAVDGDVAYAVSGACVAAAMQATTGRLLWRKQICSIARNDDTYASPVVVRGLVLFGIDIMGDRPTDRGWLVALDAATGNERWRLYPERYSGTGTGISATPAIDAANDLGFVGTGNPTPRGAPPPGPDRYSESIIAFDLRSGSIRWAFGPVHEHDLLDRDLFASPNRFQTGSGAAKRWVIGEAGKDDTYYAVDERTGHELWRTDLGGSPTAQVIGTSAYADGRLFVPIYDDARGWIVALSATNGAILWRRTLRAGGYEAPVVWGNVVFVTNIRGELFGFDARNGRLLLERHVGTRCAGRGPSAVGSALYVASLDTLTQYTIIPR
jgi:outer membrane protein assembly factor BamB